MNQYKGYKVVFTGHSLGGGLTTHAATDAVLSGHLKSSKEVHIYTYGQPRVGDTEFYKLLNGKVSGIYRVTNEFDPVPHLPPCVPDNKGGCLHTGGYLVSAYHSPQEIMYSPKEGNVSKYIYF